MSTPTAAQQRARTKIVATVGPACSREDQLAELVEAGADVFRLNMAHGVRKEHESVVRSIRAVSRRIDRPIAVLVDLAGPKIRLGELAGGQVEFQADAIVRFVRGESARAPDELATTYPGLIDELEAGDRVMLADGTVGLTVEEVNRDEARCRVTQPGTVRSRQGVNLPGAKLKLPAMSESDRKHAAWAADQGVDFVGLSFVRSAAEVHDLKELLRSRKSPAKVIAKIEKPEALYGLEEIVAAADGVMVARGDLGVESDVARMPVVQKQIVAACNRHQKPVIVATQMLDSMQRSRTPTRAEATDVANAILDGCDACMLSGETAVGEYPKAAVEMMNRIALATEPELRERPPPPMADVPSAALRRVSESVVYGVQFIARQLDARLVVVVTHSGATALALSKRRSHVPIVAVTDSEHVGRQMCLYWGVVPLERAPTRDSRQLLKYVEGWGRNDGCLAPGDHLILVTGSGLESLGHNMLLVHEVADDEEQEKGKGAKGQRGKGAKGKGTAGRGKG